MTPVEARYLASLDCDDPKCNDPLHRQEIDNICSKLSDICLSAADKTLPNISSKKTIPSWNKDTAPLKSEVQFWGKIWWEMNRPSQSVVHDIYKSCRRNYHYAIRANRRREKQLRMTKLAENIAKNDSRNLWKEISKLRGHSKLSPPHVDGVTDGKEITDLFKNKY